MSDNRERFRNALTGNIKRYCKSDMLFLFEESSREGTDREVHLYDHPNWGDGLVLEIRTPEGNTGHTKSIVDFCLPVCGVAELLIFLREYIEDKLRFEEEYYEENPEEAEER